MYGRGTRIAGRTTVSQKRSYESLFPVDSTATFLLFLPSFFFFLCPRERERDDLPDKLHFSIVSQSKVPLARLLLPFLPSSVSRSQIGRERGSLKHNSELRSLCRPRGSVPLSPLPPPSPPPPPSQTTATPIERAGAGAGGRGARTRGDVRGQRCVWPRDGVELRCPLSLSLSLSE